MFTLLTVYMNFVRLLEYELKFFIFILFSRIKSIGLYHIQIIHPYRYYLNIECIIKLKSKKLRYDKINN